MSEPFIRILTQNGSIEPWSIDASICAEPFDQCDGFVGLLVIM